MLTSGMFSVQYAVMAARRGFLLLTVVAAVSGHRYSAGKCANVKPMDDFNPDGVRKLRA